MSEILIRRLRPEDKFEWLRMRHLLWPGHSDEEMLSEMNEIISNAEEQPVFVAIRPTGGLGGFLEGGTSKYADGCANSPVGYIEGWYVDEELRQKGVGGSLVQAMEDWARARGLTEMGSDTWLENETSIAVHGRLGYVEMERLVHFAKKL